MLMESNSVSGMTHALQAETCLFGDVRISTEEL